MAEDGFGRLGKLAKIWARVIQVSRVETGAERHNLQAEKKTRAANFYLFQQLNPLKLLNSQILGKWRSPHDSLAVTSSISAEKSSSSHDFADLLQLFPHYLMSLIVT